MMMTLKLKSLMQSYVLTAELELIQLCLRKQCFSTSQSEAMKTPIGGDDDPLWRAASVVHVSRQWKFLTLFGLKESVGQSDGVHSCHSGIFVEIWVDVEEHWHVHFLVGV